MMMHYVNPAVTGATVLMISQSGLRQPPVCPDLLAWEEIGAADNWRGRFIRLSLFWMRWWAP